MFKFIFISLFVTSLTFADSEFDKKEELNGVFLKSSKTESLRTYIGSVEKTYSYPLELVKKAVTNFAERCNNSFKSKRKFTDENYDCRHHNENVIETLVVKDVNKLPGLESYSEYYLLGRQIYNRSKYGYYELVTIKESTNDKNQKVITVVAKMLKNDEVKKFTEPKIEFDSAFDDTLGVFTLTEVSPNETHLSYDYKADTTHWLLNKEISIPQVFASMSRSIGQLVKSVEEESIIQKREIASKQ